MTHQPDTQVPGKAGVAGVAGVAGDGALDVLVDQVGVEGDRRR